MLLFIVRNVLKWTTKTPVNQICTFFFFLPALQSIRNFWAPSNCPVPLNRERNKRRETSRSRNSNVRPCFGLKRPTSLCKPRASKFQVSTLTCHLFLAPMTRPLRLAAHHEYKIWRPFLGVIVCTYVRIITTTYRCLSDIDVDSTEVF